MANFEDVIAAATRRLRLDRELQLEIARELRTHLEDSHAEYLAAGYPAEEAGEQAVRHLGDPDRLATDLWLANRWRLRLRAILKWAAQIALLPAAIAISLLVIPWSDILTCERFFETFKDSSKEPQITPQFSAAELAALTPDQRYLLLGDPAAKANFERAEAVATRWPSDPVFQGNFTTWASIEYGKRAREGDAGALRWYLGVLGHGKQVDADNGQYDLLEASARMDRAVELGEKPELAFRYSENDTAKNIPFYTLTLRDPQEIPAALAALERALDKKAFVNQSTTLARAQIDMLPPPHNLAQLLYRSALAYQVLLPELGWTRRLARQVTAYALVLAKDGNLPQAITLTGQIERMGSWQAANSNTLIGVLVGQANADMGVACRAIINENYGNPHQAARARNDFDAVRAEYLRIKSIPDRDLQSYLRQASTLTAYLVPNVPEFRPDSVATLGAEHAVVQRVGLSAMLAILDVLALLLAGFAMATSVAGGVSRPVLLWIGWRRVGWICLRAVALPVAGYVLYVLSPLANRQFGFNYMSERFIVEALALALLVIVLIYNQTTRAVEERAAELGALPRRVEQLRSRRWLHRAGTVIFMLLVLGYLAAWQIDALRPHAIRHQMLWPHVTVLVGEEPLTRVGGALVVVLGAGVLSYAALRLANLIRLSRQDRALAGTLARSAVPIIAAAVVLLGVIGWAGLVQAEAIAMRRAGGSQAITIFNEIKGSAYRELQAFHARRLQQMNAVTTSPTQTQPVGSE